MTKRTLQRIVHKLRMQLNLDARQDNPVPTLEDVRAITRDAEHIAALIVTEYEAKHGAGAMWLEGRIKDLDWFDRLQEAAWKTQ